MKDEGAPILTPVHQHRTQAMYFPDETFLPKSNLPYVEARVNSKAEQLTENGAEIVRLFARFALGASFISAVADRFGLWGPYGAKNVSWGDFAHFVEYTGAVMSLFPSSLRVSFAWAATIAETLFGILLIAGFKVRIVSVLSGLLLLSFAMGMVTGLGIKTPFDYSVFSAAAAAFLVAFREPDRFTLDKLLNRS
jgi:uncharacterized membrane protein YphA (DoxX/SURF4 family)